MTALSISGAGTRGTRPIAEMKAVREQGAKLPEIGARVGLPTMTVKRILDRRERLTG